MGRFVTNRGDIESQLRHNHWIVAFSRRELTETDALEVLVAVGGAIYTGQPEIVVAFLEELVNESIAGMEQAMEQTFASDLMNEIKNYAIPIITNYLFGFSSGESNTAFGHFGVKAGVAKFIGHNEEWNPFNNVDGFLGSLGQEDAGEWQQAGPGLVSYCPYVGIRFIQNISNPPPPPDNIKVKFTNDAPYAVDFFLNGSGPLSASLRLEKGAHETFNLNLAPGFTPYVRIRQPDGTFQDFSLPLEDQKYRFRRTPQNKVINAFD